MYKSTSWGTKLKKTSNKGVEMIIPLGEKRDKLIAKIKGCDIHKWSSDRNASLKLWDEIKCYAKTITEYANGQVWIHCFKNEEEAKLEDGFIWVDGIGIPDAISKAWIKWIYMEVKT